MILSNCQLKDGKIVAELSNLFQILADGAAEEKRLVEEFGSEYRNYKESTPMIVPGFKWPSRRKSAP